MTRTLPLLAVTQAASRDSDPDAIDTATEVYGDWPADTEPCERSPVGQCVYSEKDNHRLCIYCGSGSGAQ